MHPEHEQMMRQEFFEQAQRARDAYRSDVTSTELDRIDLDVAAYDERWLGGPHADQWAFLAAAYDDWRRQPKQMQRFVGDIDANRSKYGKDFGLTDVQYRSMMQARELTSHQTTRHQPSDPRPVHGLERGW